MTTDLVLAVDDQAHHRARTAALVEAWVDAKRESPNTQKAYRVDLAGCGYPAGQCRHRDPGRHHVAEAWLPWCWTRGVDPLGHVRAAHLLAWLADLTTRGDAERTRGRRLAAVSGWYRYLRREGVVPANPVDLLDGRHERPRTTGLPSPTGALTPDQVRRMVAQADLDGQRRRNLRTPALVAMLASTGARIGELLDANTSDVTLAHGQTVLRVIGKGRVERLLPITPGAFARLDAYLASRDDLRDGDNLPTTAGHAHAPRPLFVRRGGARLDPATVWELLGRLARQAGDDLATLRVTAHWFRHSYATNNLNAGRSPRDVQRALGHASMDTTSLYDHGADGLDRHPTYAYAGDILPPTQPVG